MPKSGRADIGRRRRQIHVAGEAFDQQRFDPTEQVRLTFDYSATHRDPPGRGCAHQHVAQLCDRPGDRIPKRVRDGQSGNIFVTEAGLDRAARSEPFDAIAVERTGPRPIVAGKPRHADVSKLAMGEAAGRPTVDDQADADPGADGDISEIVKAPAGAPQHLGKGGAVDVGVKRSW